MFVIVGTWWNSGKDIVCIDGDNYVLSGWNGEQYSHCFRVADNLIDIIPDENFSILRPIWKEITEDEWAITGYRISAGDWRA